VRDELPKERPDRRDTGVDLLYGVDAEVARPARTPERVQRLLIDAKSRQILEQRAITPAVSGCVNPFRRQAMISRDAHGVPVRWRTACGVAPG
jgi:hypothetical protein